MRISAFGKDVRKKVQIYSFQENGFKYWQEEEGVGGIQVNVWKMAAIQHKIKM